MYIHTPQVQTIARHYINHAQCVYQKLPSPHTAVESTRTTQHNTSHILACASYSASYASYNEQVSHSLNHFRSSLHRYADIHHSIGAHLQETMLQLCNYDAALAQNFSSPSPEQ